RIEYRWAAGEAEGIRAQAAELVGTMPDLILANSTPVLAALRQKSAALPMVFVQVTDPVGSGFVPNLARPGGNLTGFTNFEFTIGSKWLEVLKEISPALTRVAVLFNPQTAPFADLFLQPIAAAGQSLSIAPVVAPVRDGVAFDEVI